MIVKPEADVEADEEDEEKDPRNLTVRHGVPVRLYTEMENGCV